MPRCGMSLAKRLLDGAFAGRYWARPMPQVRLQKILAQAGVASRRAAEQLIVDGRVRINGQVARVLGTRADPTRSKIEVEGRGEVTAEPLAYALLHKPPFVISTVDDPEGRDTVLDVLQRTRAEGPRQFEGELPRLFPVGRLDFDAEGFILLTNDGPLTHALLHPKRHVPKTYTVKVRGRPRPEAIVALREGVNVYDEPGAPGFRSAPAEARVVRESPANTWIELTLFEGRSHQVKRMCAAIGHACLRLVRTEFGGLELGSLPTGAWRFLRPTEVHTLQQWQRGRG